LTLLVYRIQNFADLLGAPGEQFPVVNTRHYFWRSGPVRYSVNVRAIPPSLPSKYSTFAAPMFGYEISN